MTIQELLASKGLEENKNYSISVDENDVMSITPLLSKRWVSQAQSEQRPLPLPEYDPETEEPPIQEYELVILGNILVEEEYMPEIASVQDLQKEIEVLSGLKAQELGAKIIAKVWAINEAKNLSAQDFNALMDDTSLARIERLLWTGSLKTAKLLITALDNTYFSAEEKAEILAMINDSGLV